MGGRGIVWRGLLAWAGVVAVALAVAASASAGVGQVRTVPCRLDGATRCGTLEVPVDRTGAVSGTMRIWFELDRARRGARRGTLLAMEGGPGYATSDSRDFFRGIYGPLLDHYDLVLVDARGTGKSGPINCPLAQRGSRDVIASGRQCAAILGRRIEQYRTTAVADDVVDVLDALKVGKVGFYGDSYGTFFGQTLLGRHPDRVAHVVLDGTYPVSNLDPTWPDLPDAFRDGMRLVCRRAPDNCSGDPIARGRILSARLRAAPLRGTAHGLDGRRANVLVDEDRFSSFAQYIASDPTLPIYVELDPATRAALAGDAAPLLRLQLEHGGGDGGKITSFSAGLGLAVTCLDYPQLWDTAADPATRRAQFEAAVGRIPSSVFDPFSARAWFNDPLYSYRTCTDWPVRKPYTPPVPGGPQLPAVPALLLNGDLDAVTSPEGAKVVAGRIKGSRYVEFANAGHVTTYSEGSAACANTIVQAFVAGKPLKAACAAKAPPIRPVPAFPRRLSATPQRCRAAGVSAGRLRAASAAALTVDDVRRRLDVVEGTGHGLRGGTFTYDDKTATLRGVRFTSDLAVSGTLLRAAAGPAGPVTLSGAAIGRLRVTWLADGGVRVTGTVGGARVAARCTV